MRAILLKTDGTMTEVQPRKGREFSLDELYGLIGCDIVEHVGLVPGVHLWVDEEGKLKDGGESNERATQYLHKAFPPERWRQMGVEPDFIVGNAVIVDQTKAGWL